MASHWGKTVLSLLLSGALAFPISAAAEFSDAVLSGDTHTRSASATSNFGGTTQVLVRNTVDLRYGFVKFDITPFIGKVITKGRFKIKPQVVTAAGTLSLSNMDSGWSEFSLTYNNTPGIQSPGASLPIASGDANKILEADVTTIVQGWVASPSTNNGLALVPSSGLDVTLYSKESNNVAAELEIEFTTPTQQASASFSASHGADAMTVLMHEKGLFSPHPDNCDAATEKFVKVGTTSVGSTTADVGVCIEKAPRNNSTVTRFSVARATCLAEGKRLPEFSEFQKACFEGGLTPASGTSEYGSNFPVMQNWFWSFHRAGMHIPAVNASNCTWASNANIASSDDGENVLAFRCVR